VAVVVDASVVLVLVSGDSRREAAQRAMREWVTRGERVHAPSLMPYEVASGMTRLIHAGALPADRAESLWRLVDALPIVYHPLAGGAGVTDLALRLRRRSAYDAAYLALAQSLGAELWAFDGPLATNAASLGLPVREPR